jgi:hypothetical protein
MDVGRLCARIGVRRVTIVEANTSGLSVWASHLKPFAIGGARYRLPGLEVEYVTARRNYVHRPIDRSEERIRVAKLFCGYFRLITFWVNRTERSPADPKEDVLDGGAG